MKLKRFWPLVPAAFLALGLALSSQPAAAVPAPPPVAQADEAALAAVGKRLDNDDDSTYGGGKPASVKMFRSANCYDNPNSVDTRVIGAGHSTIEYAGWSSWQSYRLFVDASIEVTVWTSGAWVASISQNVPTGGSVCRNASVDNRRYRVFQYPGLVKSTAVRTASGVTAEPIGHIPQVGPFSTKKTLCDDNVVVGCITGYYYNVSQGGPLYSGVKQPSANHCVLVQRKTLSTGIWTSDGVVNPTHCQATHAETWSIRDAGYISNTTAIRLYKPITGQFVVLCVTKSECLAM